MSDTMMRNMLSLKMSMDFSFMAALWKYSLLQKVEFIVIIRCADGLRPLRVVVGAAKLSWQFSKERLK